jgi:hypothetical protein
MGEYAKFCGQEIKIGTCEDMYYLRYDQAHLVSPMSGNVDPVRDRAGLRFRFPFPDEDSVSPGEFDNPFRSASVYVDDVDWEGIDHHTIQFRNDRGLIVNLPCPEVGGNPLRIMKNGYAGNIAVVQQRWVDGILVTVCQCGSCGAAFRLPDLDHARPILDALRRRTNMSGRDGYLSEIADRIEAGYDPQFVTACRCGTRKEATA